MTPNAIKIEFGFGVVYDAEHRALHHTVIETGLERIKAVAVELWGAYTLTPVNGGWTNPAGTLTEEPGFTLTILTRKNNFNPLGMVDTIKSALRQEAVAVTITPVNFEIL